MVVRPSRIIAVITVIAAAFAAEPARSLEINTFAELSRYFRGDITLEVKNGATRLKYCPNITCDIFWHPADENVNDLVDFVYLYYMFVDSYDGPEMERFREIQGTTVVRLLLDRHTSGCLPGQDYVHCVLLSLAEKSRIALAGNLLDEGSENEWESDLESKIDGNLIPFMVLRHTS